ncbi:unnamed protein product [Ectocarpus sp. 12 AP-2014]
MMFTGRRAAQVAVLVATQAWRGDTECAFRLDGHLDITQPLTLIAPYVDPGSGYRLINPYNPIVYLVNENVYDRYPVNCSVDSWRYLLDNNVTYATNVTFPDANATENATEVSVPGLFAAESHELFIDSYSADKAVAISDSLFGRTIEVALSCDQVQTVTVEDSCLQFQLNFTNGSPEVDKELLESALYRFEEPAVPGVVLPLAGAYSPGDVWLNEGNPIVDIDGSVTDEGCNGEVSEYLGEDGEWYYYFTGSDGNTYNMTHVFYATEQDHLNVAKIQAPWSPNLERALFNRTVRMSIYCNNINEREDGYVLFKVGDGNGYFDINVADYEAILTDSGSSAFATPWGGGAAGRGWLSSAFTFVVVGALTAWVGKLSESS